MAFILFMVAGRWVGRSGVSKVTKHFVLFDTGSARPSVVGTGPWWCWWSRISHIRDDHENSHGRHVSNVWQCCTLYNTKHKRKNKVISHGRNLRIWQCISSHVKSNLGLGGLTTQNIHLLAVSVFGEQRSLNQITINKDIADSHYNFSLIWYNLSKCQFIIVFNTFNMDRMRHC